MCVSDGSIFLFSVCFFNQYIIFFAPYTNFFLKFHFKDNKLFFQFYFGSSWTVDLFLLSFQLLYVFFVSLIKWIFSLLIFYFNMRDFSLCLRLSRYMTLILPYYFTFSITIILCLFFPVFHPKDMNLIYQFRIYPSCFVVTMSLA